jgi:CubicO group peptidase (beta-lactamase class C family)
MRVPGMAIGIVADDQLSYAAGFGVAGLGDQRPVTPETLFHMASVTKTFVATAVLQLVEDGRVELDAPVTDYLPYFTLADGRASDVTVRQMLSHTGAMPDEDDFGWERPEYDDGALERYVRGLSDRSLIGEPGAQFKYSNIAYEVLGDVIAKVSSRTFEDQVHERILIPLGMTSSTLLVQEADPGLLSRGHLVDPAGEIVVSDVFPYHRAHAPSSTLYTNVRDLSRWALANMNGGELNGARILSRTSLDLMWQPVAPRLDWRHEQMGLGWFLHTYRGRRVVWHDGADTGFMSILCMLPDERIAVIVFCNSDYVWDGPWHIASAALEILLGPER